MKKAILIILIYGIMALSITGCGNNNTSLDDNSSKEGTVENNEIKSYTITFDTNGGTNIESQEVTENETITKPDDPSKDGYTFASWTLDGEEFDFSTKITSDLTLKAKWNKNKSTSQSKSETSKTSDSSTSEKTTDSTSNKNKLGANEYYALKDGQIHKYSLVYSTLSACENSAEGENLGDDFPYGQKIYQILQCDEIKDANGTHYWGMYFIDSISNQTGFYY